MFNKIRHSAGNWFFTSARLQENRIPDAANKKDKFVLSRSPRPSAVSSPGTRIWQSPSVHLHPQLGGWRSTGGDDGTAELASENIAIKLKDGSRLTLASYQRAVEAAGHLRDRKERTDQIFTLINPDGKLDRTLKWKCKSREQFVLQMLDRFERQVRGNRELVQQIRRLRDIIYGTIILPGPPEPVLPVSAPASVSDPSGVVSSPVSETSLSPFKSIWIKTKGGQELTFEPMEQNVLKVATLPTLTQRRNYVYVQTGGTSSHNHIINSVVKAWLHRFTKQAEGHPEMEARVNFLKKILGYPIDAGKTQASVPLDAELERLQLRLAAARKSLDPMIPLGGAPRVSETSPFELSILNYSLGPRSEPMPVEEPSPTLPPSPIPVAPSPIPEANPVPAPTSPFKPLPTGKGGSQRLGFETFEQAVLAVGKRGLETLTARRQAVYINCTLGHSTDPRSAKPMVKRAINYFAAQAKGHVELEKRIQKIRDILGFPIDERGLDVASPSPVTLASDTPAPTAVVETPGKDSEEKVSAPPPKTTPASAEKFLPKASPIRKAATASPEVKRSGGAQKVVPSPAVSRKTPDLAPDQLEQLMDLQKRFKARLDDIVGNWRIYLSPEPSPLKEELMALKKDIEAVKPVGERLARLSQNEELLKLAKIKPGFRQLNDQLGELLRWMRRLQDPLNQFENLIEREK